MDKDFIIEHDAVDAQKRFQMLCEYTFITNNLNEDGEEDEMGQNDAMPQGGSQEKGQDMPPMDGLDKGGDMPPMDSGEKQGAGGDMPPMDGAENGAGAEMPPMDGGGNIGNLGDTLKNDEGAQDSGSDDEVIDVDELVDSQEDTEEKVEKVGSELKGVIDRIDSLLSRIDQSDASIRDLKAEFEKRNPTDNERLNIRTQASYPFSILPDNDKKVDGNIVLGNVDSENDDDDMEYEIKRSDVEVNNPKQVSDTLDGMDLEKMFGY